MLGCCISLRTNNLHDVRNEVDYHYAAYFKAHWQVVQLCRLINKDDFSGLGSCMQPPDS